MPLNKRSIKFLRKASKSENGVKSMGRKRRRKEEPDMEVEEVESAIPMSELKATTENEPRKK